MAFAMPKSATTAWPLSSTVLRLDVAVNDAVGVSVARRIGDLAGDLKRIVDGKLLLAVEPGAQGLAVDQGHDVIEQLRIGVRWVRREG